MTPVPASRDSAFVRARRALQGESFTLDVVDSTGGRLSGTRWPGSNAQLGTSTACHVNVALKIRRRHQFRGGFDQPLDPPGGESAKVCEQERSQVLDRTNQVLVPSPTP